MIEALYTIEKYFSLFSGLAINSIPFIIDFTDSTKTSMAFSAFRFSFLTFSAFTWALTNNPLI